MDPFTLQHQHRNVMSSLSSDACMHTHARACAHTRVRTYERHLRAIRPRLPEGLVRLRAGQIPARGQPVREDEEDIGHGFAAVVGEHLHRSLGCLVHPCHCARRAVLDAMSHLLRYGGYSPKGTVTGVRSYSDWGAVTEVP